ncbi:MAG: hypothetical protein E4G94_09695, partial [ANME-2 cluster archaeon]
MKIPKLSKKKDQDVPEEEKSLFCWDDIPGNDNARLLEFLKDKYKIKWAKTEDITKTEDGNIIKVSFEENTLSFRLNIEKGKAYLQIGDGGTYGFIVQAENNKLNIYEDTIPLE